MTVVIHQPRIAWDGARAIVRAAGSPYVEVFAARVLDRLGEQAHQQFLDTTHRLAVAVAATGGDRHAADLEAGKWRVRLEDLLRLRPDLTDDVRELTALTRGL